MKITVIGGGSTYTPELVNGFLARVEALPIKKLWLMDIDKERLDIVGDEDVIFFPLLSFK